MNYKPVAIKILNPEEFIYFRYKKLNWAGKLSLQLRYGKKTAKNNLSITLAFRYRILLNEQHVSSFLSDYVYLLSFNFDENPYDDLVNFFGKTILYFMEELYRLTEQVEINPKSIFSQLSTDFITIFVEDVIKNARTQLLIK